MRNRLLADRKTPSSPVAGAGIGGGSLRAEPGIARLGTCIPDSTTLCLPGDGRFEVSVHYETAQGGGRTGDGRAIPLDPLGIDKGGVLYFNDPGNPELVVKVINACSVNDRFWVFYAATTNVGFELTVTDTVAGTTKSYVNPDLNPADAVTDTQGFATCP